VVVSARTTTRRSNGARGLAARVIERVEVDRAFASAALDAELGRAVQFERRDRALATELVYGSLRVVPWLEQELARFAPRGIARLDARVRAHLVVAAYQLFFTRVPAFAAVSEAVDAIRDERGERLASFANACLRKVASRASVSGDLTEQAVVESVPAWLRDALHRVFSPEQALAFLRCGTEPPPAVLRVERAGERDAWLERLRRAAPAGSFERGRLSPHAILVRGAGKLQELPGWEAGAWSIQEEASQLVTLAVGARAGETVLDACSGRGNKTAILARAVREKGDGAVDACDVNAAKLAALGQELARLRLSTRRTLAVDWTVGSGEVQGSYDRVLVDAPCTGVGTLRRRPEMALRPAPDLASITRSQLAIVSRAAQHVRKGGVLVYVVCSVLREEGEDVVAALAHAHGELEPASFDLPVVRGLFGDAPSFRLLPQEQGTDGYFVAKFVRRS
jgi:16S rRNA (cytosine967-C5)-methyltransferase